MSFSDDEEDFFRDLVSKKSKRPKSRKRKKSVQSRKNKKVSFSKNRDVPFRLIKQKLVQQKLFEEKIHRLQGEKEDQQDHFLLNQVNRSNQVGHLKEVINPIEHSINLHFLRVSLLSIIKGLQFIHKNPQFIKHL